MQRALSGVAFRMLVGAAALMVSWLSIGRASALESACGIGRPWVKVVITGPEPAFSNRLLKDLRAGLSPSRIDACFGGGPPPRKEPLATVQVSVSATEPLAYSIDVSDSVTQKRIGRDVDLGHLPRDGRAFALALAAEELLRASWADLALAKAREVRPVPPRPRPAAPPQTLPEPEVAASLPALGLGIGLEDYGGGQTHFGADVSWSQPATAGIALNLAVGARQALSVDSPNGSISANALSVEFALRPRLARAGLLRLEGVVGVRGSRIRFNATAAEDATSQGASGTALFARGGLSLTFGRRGSVRSVSALGAGAPLKSFSASDAGRVVTGVSGLELFARSGVALEF